MIGGSVCVILRFFEDAAELVILGTPGPILIGTGSKLFEFFNFEPVTKRKQTITHTCICAE